MKLFIKVCKAETNAHIVVEAKLVSSSLSLPSSARPRFSLLFASRGVIERVLSKVAFPSTVSLQRAFESCRRFRELKTDQ